MKQSCRLPKCCFFASLRSRSANSRHTAIDSRRSQRVADPAEPAHEARQRDARNAVGQQEVQVFLQQQSVAKCVAEVHRAVNGMSVERSGIAIGVPTHGNPSLLFALRRCAHWRRAAALRKRRLELSLAKHRSLAGHSRMAKRVARAAARLRFDEDASSLRRRAGRGRCAPPCRRSTRLSALFAERFAALAGAHRRGAPGPVGPAVHRRLPRAVPVQPLRARAAAVASFVASSQGVKVTDLDGNALLRPDRLLRRQPVRLRLLQGLHRRGQRAGARHWARCSAATTPAWPRTCARLRELSGLDEVSFHMSGTEAVMQAVRLARYHTRRSHLVRFCGAYHGWWEDVQPGPGNPLPPRETYTLKDMDARRAARAAHAARHRLRAGQPAAGAAPERERAGRFVAGRQRPPRRLRPRGLHRAGCASCARCAPSAASC